MILNDEEIYEIWKGREEPRVLTHARAVKDRSYEGVSRNQDDANAEQTSKKIRGLNQKVIEQAAVIDKLRSALIFQRSLSDLTSIAITEALAIPTDSKQILADWMREQLGEPSAYHFRDDPACFAMPGSGYSHKYPTEALDIVSLYKLPECLK